MRKKTFDQAKFEIRTRRKSDPTFTNVHPGPQAGKKFFGIDLRAWAGSEGLESDFVRCVHCGFLNDSSVRSLGSGYGNITTATISGSSALEPNVQSGCVFCGSSDYIGERLEGTVDAD